MYVIQTKKRWGIKYIWKRIQEILIFFNLAEKQEKCNKQMSILLKNPLKSQKKIMDVL